MTSGAIETRRAAPLPGGRPDDGRLNPAKVALGLAGMAVVVWLVTNLFLAFAYYPNWFANSKVIIGVLAVVAGVGGAMAFFYMLHMFVDGLPRRLSGGVIPYAFLLPGFSLIGLMLLYPTIQTVVYSFANKDSTAWVGFDNYRAIFTDGTFWDSILNNVLWLLIVPAVTVALGVVVAVLADRLSAQGEKIVKSAVFLPMAISFVGASAIWGLVYEYQDKTRSQTGLLNALVRALGGDPQTWLQVSTARLNSVLLMVILVWLQVGFSMVLLSSAIKGVPDDTLEAARIDGASELQIFWKVIIPQVKGTIITVFITVLITVLKVFDIVYVLTNGNYKTNVIANLFFNKMFADSEAGIASSIVVILLLAILPVLMYQVKQFRDAEANR
jgi:alpha-glucoside transport system permease protein